MQQWEARLTLNAMSFACGNIEIEFERDWILFYGHRQEHFETLEKAFERAYEIGVNNPFPKVKTRTKEEIIEYAKAHGAYKKGIRRFQNDEPLEYDDLKWAYEHNLDLGYEVYLRTLRQKGLTLKHVPKHQRTYELCMIAVKQFGWALQYVPKEHKTYELCMEAVKQYELTLYYVPKEHKQQIEAELN